MNYIAQSRGKANGNGRYVPSPEAIKQRILQINKAIGERKGEELPEVHFWEDNELADQLSQFEQLAKNWEIDLAPIEHAPASAPKARPTPQGGFWRQMPDAAADDPNLTDGDYRMLGILMKRCGEKDYCWPSHQTLADDLAGCGSHSHPSLSTVRRRLRHLAGKLDMDKPGEATGTAYIEVIAPENMKEKGYSHQTSGNTYKLLFLSRGVQI